MLNASTRVACSSACMNGCRGRVTPCVTLRGRRILFCIWGARTVECDERNASRLPKYFPSTTYERRARTGISIGRCMRLQVPSQGPPHKIAARRAKAWTHHLWGTPSSLSSPLRCVWLRRSCCWSGSSSPARLQHRPRRRRHHHRLQRRWLQALCYTRRRAHRSAPLTVKAVHLLGTP